MNLFLEGFLKIFLNEIQSVHVHSIPSFIEQVENIFLKDVRKIVYINILCLKFIKGKFDLQQTYILPKSVGADFIFSISEFFQLRSIVHSLKYDVALVNESVFVASLGPKVHMCCQTDNSA